MFARISSISAFFFLGLALMVSATPTPSPEMLAARGGQCNTGPLQCCNSVQQVRLQQCSRTAYLEHHKLTCFSELLLLC